MQLTIRPATIPQDYPAIAAVLDKKIRGGAKVQKSWPMLM